MKRFRWEKFGPLFPITIFIGFVLLVGGIIWIFYRLVHVSWILTAILFGTLETVLFDRAKHVWPSIWSLAANTAAMMCYIWVLFVLDTKWWWKILLLVLFTPLFILANRSTRYDIERGMRLRRERAARTLQQVLSKQGDASPRFGLYLRPFVTTERLPAQAVPSEYEPSEIGSHIDFETMLMRALDKEIELLALGRPEDISEGIARVTIDDEGWQEVVLKLADQAELIIAVPLARTGTIWELRELKARGLIGKTVFLMPEMYREQPNGVVVFTENSRIWDVGVISYNSAEHYLNVAAEWRQARENLKAEGLDLPPYSGCGALFTIDPDMGRVKQMAPLPLSVLMRKEAYIRTVLTAFELLPRRPKFNRDLLAAFEGATFPNIGTREYALFLAFDLFATFGNKETASTILQSMNRYVRGRPRLLNEAIKSFPKMLDDPVQEGLGIEDVEIYRNWLNIALGMEGLNAVSVEEAEWAVNEAGRKLGGTIRT